MTLSNLFLVLFLLLTALLPGCGTLGSGQATSTGQQLQQQGQQMAQSGAAQGNPVAVETGTILQLAGLGMALAAAVAAAFKSQSAGNTAAAAQLSADQAHQKVGALQNEQDQLWDATHAPIAQQLLAGAAPPGKP